MKKKILFVFALCAGINSVKAQNIPSYVPSNGLVGWYPFNGNANDESNKGTNGVVNGASLTTDRNGFQNKAYIFNGISSNIDLGTNQSINSILNDFSISTWIKTETLSSCFIASYSTQNTSSWRFASKIENTGYLNTGYIDSDNITWQTATSNPSKIELSKWTHYVYTRLGNISRIYLNGELVSTIILSSKPVFNPNDPYAITKIGYNYPSSPNFEYFKGVLDDIGFWDRSLTEDEIQSLYKGCNTPTATIIPKSTTTFCNGASVDLEANSGSNYTYQWYNNNQLINSATSATFKASITGKYTVIVMDGACRDTSDITNVTVNSNPAVSLASLGTTVYKTDNSITLQGTPVGGTFSGEGVSNGVFNPSISSLGRKTITYNYTSQQGCSGQAISSVIVADTLGNVCSTYDTLKIKFKLTTGIKANEFTAISAYPNPTSDVLIISASDMQALGGYKYKLVDLQGKELYYKAVTSQVTEISLNTLGAKGVYILHILDANGASVENKKIVLE